MPNNLNKANVKAFMDRVFTSRNMLVAGLGTVIVFLLYSELNHEKDCSADINQRQNYKTELAAARDSIAVLNKKLDDCCGKKKAVVKSATKSATVKKTTVKSAASVSTSVKCSESKGEALINFYDNSQNEAGGIIINVYTSEDGQNKITASAVPAQVQSSTNTRKSDTLISGSAKVSAKASAANRGRKVLITEIISTEETRTR